MLSYLWKGKKTNEIENENPEIALREALDNHGDFITDEDGTLQWEQLLALRHIIMRQACRDFHKVKDDLNTRKLEAYKAKNQLEYVSIFREGQQKFNTSLMNMTIKACEWIELGPENFQLSLQKYQDDEEKQGEI